MSTKFIRTRKLNEAPSRKLDEYEPDALPQKSFWGKARVLEYTIESDERTNEGYYKLEILKSYETYVMAKLTCYTNHNSVMISNQTTHSTSNTTLKHIKSFSGLNKKGFLALKDSDALYRMGYYGVRENLLQQLLEELLQVAKNEDVDMSY